MSNQTKPNEPHQDPLLYYALTKPFETSERANDAVSKFHEGVAKLRQECRIPDVLVVASLNVEDTEAISMAHWGDAMKTDSLAAYALGRLREQREKLIGEILKRGRK